MLKSILPNSFSRGQDRFIQIILLEGFQVLLQDWVSSRIHGCYQTIDPPSLCVFWYTCRSKMYSKRKKSAEPQDVWWVPATFLNKTHMWRLRLGPTLPGLTDILLISLIWAAGDSDVQKLFKTFSHFNLQINKIWTSFFNFNFLSCLSLFYLIILTCHFIMACYNHSPRHRFKRCSSCVCIFVYK